MKIEVGLEIESSTKLLLNVKFHVKILEQLFEKFIVIYSHFVIGDLRTY